jgi:hypothetical protein
MIEKQESFVAMCAFIMFLGKLMPFQVTCRIKCLAALGADKWLLACM